MRNVRLAQDYISRATVRLRALDVLFEGESWADVVRESQEIVELALKALLRQYGVLPPRSHDVSDVLVAERERLPAELTVEVERATTIAEVNAAFIAAAKEGPLKGILDYSEIELVSVDYIGNPFSCTIDAKSTNVIDGTMVKLSGWYDNEWGYSNRCVDLLQYVGSSLS